MVPERLRRASRIDRDRRERVAELLARQVVGELDRPQVVLVKPTRQFLKERVVWIGAYPLDDQLSAGNADRKGRALGEQQRQFAHHAVDGAVEQRMTHGIDR